VDGPAKQSEVADDIEDLVPDEFIGIAQWFVSEDGIFADDDGVFEAAAFNQPVFDEELDLFEKAKRAGMSDVALPGFWGNFEAAKLSEPTFFIGAGAGDFENLVGEKGHDCFAHFQFDWRSDGIWFAAFFLGDDSGRFDQLAIFAGAAVGDRWFVAIQFDDGIVDPVAGEGREDVFDGVDASVAFGERGRAIVFNDIFDASFDFGFSLEIDAAKAEAGIGRGGQKGHRDPVAAVQADAGKTGGAIERLLLKHAGI
jgi:hypothetical protein